MKNLMSDRCATHKKFNIFIKYKMELLPQVTKNWQKLLKEDQQSLGNVNEFFVAYTFCWDQQIKWKLALNFGEMFRLRVRILVPWLMDATTMVILEHSFHQNDF